MTLTGKAHELLFIFENRKPKTHLQLKTCRSAEAQTSKRMALQWQPPVCLTRPLCSLEREATDRLCEHRFLRWPRKHLGYIKQFCFEHLQYIFKKVSPEMYLNKVLPSEVENELSSALIAFLILLKQQKERTTVQVECTLLEYRRCAPLPWPRPAKCYSTGRVQGW